MARIDGEGVRGVLNDWDHAARVGDNGESLRSTAHARTGTWPFIALDLLVEDPPPHLYRHDLESFFYILIWAAAHFRLADSVQSKVAPALHRWTQDLETANESKELFLLGNRHFINTCNKCVQPDFNGLYQSWITPLWALFNHAFHERDRQGVSTSLDPTLGITYEKFMEAIGQRLDANTST